MKTSNVITENLRVAETSLQWEEKLTNALGSINVKPIHTFRVRATGATTVSIDGTLAATMSAGEIMIFNTGYGNIINTGLTYVVVTIAGAAAFVQVGKEIKQARLVVNPYNDLNEPFPDSSNS